MRSYTLNFNIINSTTNAQINNNNLEITHNSFSQNFIVLECFAFDQIINQEINNVKIDITITDKSIVDSSNGILELKNNTLSLILLAISSIGYWIFKKRRENGIQ
jgi:hypothetical protein